MAMTRRRSLRWSANNWLEASTPTFPTHTQQKRISHPTQALTTEALLQDGQKML